MPRCAPAPPICPIAAGAASFASPFDYPANSRIIVVTDVARDDMASSPPPIASCSSPPAAAASACSPRSARLRAVHRRIAAPLARAGLPLYAQHVDPIDTGTLVDMFRAERDACLLGTDAVRDGVDVPGHSLRLVVLERVPWPRPTILHAPGASSFGGRPTTTSGVRLQAAPGLRPADPARRRPRRASSCSIRASRRASARPFRRA